MKQHALPLLTALVLHGAAATATAASPAFSGTAHQAIRCDAPASSGLEAVYVLDSTAGAAAQWTAASPSAVTCYRFSNLGGAYAEEIPSQRQGDTVTIPLSDGDMGYIIDDSGTRTCFWVTDYSRHSLALGSIDPAPGGSDCTSITLDFTGDASEIPYYTINGRRMVLSRDLHLTYLTLAFDDDTFAYRQQTATENLDAVAATVTAPAPLCDTQYTLSGDRFLRQWGREESITSPTAPATAPEAHTRATQTPRQADNEQSAATDGLGGSAPCEVEFEAAVSDAAIFRQWQISRTPEFDILENSYTELQFTHTFTEQGTTYVRFIADNASGTCPFQSETYEILISESRLDIPNAFSPQGSPGVNDEWKVSYKSLVTYECHIFNRWGKELFSSSDPAQGWDGRSGGKYVPAGVYFYVIKARGADGIVYDRAGDINIINYTNTATQTD